jgi:DNA-binding helix-hairpin-helix protein with protein kinase domain
LHTYYRGLPSCPWCELERSSGIPFFVGRVVVKDVREVQDVPIDEIWSRILAIPSPGPAPTVAPNSATIVYHPLPYAIKLWLIASPLLVASTFIGGTVLAVTTKSNTFITIGFWGALLLGWLLYSPATRPKELNRRKMVLRQAEMEWREALGRWNALGDHAFRNILADLAKTKKACECLRSEHAKARVELESNLREHRLAAFLGTFHIYDCSIPGIGDRRKATLASFGIETAADVERNRIMRISGFGYNLTSVLLAWRDRISERFVFDPSEGVTAQEMASLDRRFQGSQTILERQLRSGPRMLASARDETLRARALLDLETRKAATNMAQARADMSLRR